jgi:phage terminase large subunit-like protein
MYEIYPQGHTQAGRRRFKRVGLSLAKGLAKTEFAAWIAACELHPDAPVRCLYRRTKR